MIFLSAWAFGLLSLAGIIALLYFLRRREERVVVSAIWLWEEELERPRSALTFLWTKIWLLLVQVAALVALVFSLAHPMLTQEFLGGGTLALILDGSASMQTLEGERTRYDLARARAMELIEKRRPARLTIIQAQQNPKLLVPLTEDKAQALALLRASQPTLQSDASPLEVLELVRSQGELDQFTEVIYIGDHLLELPITQVIVGEPKKNLAITGLAARPLPDGSSRVVVWARVENFSSEALEGTLYLFAEEVEILQERLYLGPGERRMVEAIAPGYTRFRAMVDVADDFAFDNVRYAIVPRRPKLKIRWLGERNFFLLRALNTFAEPSLHTDESERYDLTIAINSAIRPLGAALLVNSVAEPWVVRPGIISELGSLQILTPTHPVVQNVRAEHLRSATLPVTQLASGVQTLIASGDQPIVAVYRSEGLSFVYLGVDLKNSPLVLTPSFPILVRNSIYWLLPDLGLSSERFVSDELATPGFTDQIAINLDPTESEINRAHSHNLVAQPSLTKEIHTQMHVPLWYLGVWVALGLLFVELLWYYRSLWRRGWWSDDTL